MIPFLTQETEDGLTKYWDGAAWTMEHVDAKRWTWHQTFGEIARALTWHLGQRDGIVPQWNEASRLVSRCRVTDYGLRLDGRQGVTGEHLETLCPAGRALWRNRGSHVEEL